MKINTDHTFQAKLLALCLIFCVHLELYGQVKNYALDLPGTSPGVVDFGDINQVDNVAEFTFECWVKLDSWKEWAYVFSKINNTSDGIDIQLGAQGMKRIYFHVANGGNNYAAVDNVPINVGQWHHIVMAYDGSQPAYNQVDIYIDGVSMNKWYKNGDGLLPAATPATSASFLLGQNFDGKIDEVRLWSIKLLASDIVPGNTVDTNHRLYSDLTGYWRMDQHTNASSIIDYKQGFNGSISTGVNRILVTDNNGLKYKIVSAYIRPQFYEAGAVDNEYLRNNNDIINIVAFPYADGELFFDFPVSTGVLTNTTHLNTFSGRNGVLDFNGTGSKMNGGKHLVNLATGGVRNLAFEAWVYLDSWVNWSYIFRKQGSTWLNKIDLQLGGDVNTQQLYFHVNDGSNTYAAVNNSGLTVGHWHHVAVVYRGNQCPYEQVKIYVDGVEKNLWYSSGNGVMPATAPFVRDDFELGVDFDGKIDEAMIFRVPISAGNIINHMNNGVTNNGWPNNQITAYWKFDDATDPGKDSKNWVNIHNAINAVIAGYDGVQHRLGVAQGDWQAMMQSSTARQNFANNVRVLIDQYAFDGVDLDFEWCYNNTQCWTNYGSTITALDNVLLPGETFSVTLHPLAYKLPANAHALLDFVSIQSYGPSPTTFPYSKYVSDIQLFLGYGYPKNKLVAGVPFYGVSDPKGLTVAYTEIINAHPNINPATDQVSMLRNVTTGSGCSATTTQQSVNIVFNGQNTITQKTGYANDQGLAGIMYWDTATDLAYSNPLCLLRALNAEMNANIQIPVTTSSARIAGFDGEVMADPVSKDKVLLYPNPSLSHFNIQVPSSKNFNLIQVFDLRGRIRYLSGVNTVGVVRIETRGFSKGLYFVRLSNTFSGEFEQMKLKIE